ncbi:MAG: chromate transporter [Clostridia bacterium]|nr:chromate transporter [Clostridia bacterium]
MRRDSKRAPKGAVAGLFGGMLAISACTFGGGFVIVTLMKRRFVDERGWLSEREMLDYTALAQATPGSIAINAAILTGWRVAGLPGMLAALLGTVIPPVAALSLISLVYEAFAANALVRMAMRGMQAGVAAVLLGVVCDLGGDVIRSRSAPRVAVMLAAFAASEFFHIHVALIIVGAALAGALSIAVQRRRKA